MPSHLSAMWWTSELARQLLFFSLATWQHQNTYLHDKEEQTKLMDERWHAVEKMASWYICQHKFPKEDQSNFACTFLDRCSDTTK